MIQIRENDFLWKWYKVYYKEISPPPHPKSVCNFFWKSVGGIFKYIWDDSPSFVVIPIFILVLAGLMFLDSFIDPSDDKGFFYIFCSLLFVLSLMVYTAFISAFILYRGNNFLNNKGKFGKIIKNIFGYVFIYMIFSFVFSLAFKGKDEHWQLIYLWYGMLLTGVFCITFSIVLFIIWFFSKDTPTKQLITAYFMAVKNQVCPLVKAPWEEENTLQKP